MNSHIQLFTLEGAFLGEWGSDGQGDGQFKAPKGVMADNGHIYVAGSGDNRIQMLIAGGTFITEFGDIGSEPGQLFDPSDLCVNINNGQIYVADSGNNRIQIFKENRMAIGNYYS